MYKFSYTNNNHIVLLACNYNYVDTHPGLGYQMMIMTDDHVTFYMKRSLQLIKVLTTRNYKTTKTI